MAKYLVTVIIFIVSTSFQHYIPPPDPCAYARICNHTWIVQCGHETNDLNKRWFLDECDMFEYNCDHKKNFTHSESSGCPNNITQNSTSSTIIPPINLSSVKSSDTTESNYSPLRNTSKESLSTTTFATVCYTVNDTGKATNITVSVPVTTLNTTPLTPSSLSPKFFLPVTSPKQNVIMTNNNFGRTSMTESLSITSTSLSDSIIQLELESTTEFSSLPSLEIITNIPGPSTFQSNRRRGIKLATVNISGNCTSMTKTMQCITQPIAQYISELTEVTDLTATTELMNPKKQVSISTETSLNKHSCTRNMSSQSFFDSDSNSTNITEITVIMNRKTTSSDNFTTTDIHINSASINSFITNETEKQKTKPSDDKTALTKVHKENITTTKGCISNTLNFTLTNLNMSLVKTEITNATSSFPVTTRESKTTLVKCNGFPKDCNRPVTWETTEKGETRDFYQILKARFGNKVRLLRDTTHWANRALRYVDDTDTF